MQNSLTPRFQQSPIASADKARQAANITGGSTRWTAALCITRRKNETLYSGERSARRYLGRHAVYRL
uniref:hypothetical protein n=1 Tax=Pantoea septica TaxID=472695 RepID=UPI0028B00D1A